jgi:hypothetical protein
MGPRMTRLAWHGLEKDLGVQHPALIGIGIPHSSLRWIHIAIACFATLLLIASVMSTICLASFSSYEETTQQVQ